VAKNSPELFGLAWMCTIGRPSVCAAASFIASTRGPSLSFGFRTFGAKASSAVFVPKNQSLSFENAP
jgi:hypothetical protein